MWSGDTSKLWGQCMVGRTAMATLELPGPSRRCRFRLHLDSERSPLPFSAVWREPRLLDEPPSRLRVRMGLQRAVRSWPVSEASIGQIQRYCCAYGFVDHVITPNCGMVWLVPEMPFDRYVTRPIENRTPETDRSILALMALNPPQTFANMMTFQYPWRGKTEPVPLNTLASCICGRGSPERNPKPS